MSSLPMNSALVAPTIMAAMTNRASAMATPRSSLRAFCSMDFFMCIASKVARDPTVANRDARAHHGVEVRAVGIGVRNLGLDLDRDLLHAGALRRGEQGGRPGGNELDGIRLIVEV